LNVLYIKEEIYESKRYKDPITGLIQVFCEKVNKKETSYQIACREIREEIDLHTVLKYLIKDNKFNYNLYTIDITERELLQWLKLEKNESWVFYNWIK